MGTQRAILHLLTITLMASACLAASGQTSTHEENTTNWGNTPGLRSPHPDSKGRSGHWWWPELSEPRSKGAALTGNQGRVFSNRTVETSSKLPVPPDPPAWIPENVIVCGPRIVWDNILFAFDSVQLSEEGKSVADKLIGEMSKFPNDTAVCVGHTDDIGPEDHNFNLGLHRAQAVVNYMAANGIAPKRLRAESRGETEPAVPNDTPPNRALNRRVVFEITYGD